MIDRADRFGLAQLHQLRGRVGRSHHRAYAYLIVPPRKQLTADASNAWTPSSRWKILAPASSWHPRSGNRGAGELLGESQSGELSEVGLAMFLDMLERAVEALKDGREPQLDKPLAARTEVELHVPAFLPDDYVADVHVRLGCTSVSPRPMPHGSMSSPPSSSIASANCPRRPATCSRWHD